MLEAEHQVVASEIMTFLFGITNALAKSYFHGTPQQKQEFCSLFSFFCVCKSTVS